MKISAVIPTYNRARYLGRTVESLLAQTRPPDEIVVVDDGSTDDTREVVRRYAGAVTYLYRDNGGISRARNLGMAHMTGDALLFIDSDDLLLPAALAVLEAALEPRPDAPLAFCRAQLIDEADRIVAPLWKAEGDDAEDTWCRLIHSNYIRSAGAVLLRRSFLEPAGPWDNAVTPSEDWDLWLRLAEKGGFILVREPLFQYRIHGGNLSADAGWMRRSGLAVYEKQLERQRNNPERLAAVRRQYAICVAPVLQAAASEQFAPAPPIFAAPAASLSRRHAALRGVIEMTGIAVLYRRVPLRVRLGMRRAFGIDLNA